jgi:ABC-type multidrug transport system ATPase subunit
VASLLDSVDLSALQASQHARVPTPPFVEARDVIKRYRDGVEANAGVCFEARLGEVVALLGANGAGKTTFVLQLLGLLKPSSGCIRVGDVDVVRDPAGVKRLASYQPQSHAAMGGVVVRQALVLTGRLRGQTAANAERVAGELVAHFGLESILRQPLNRLSGGWRRLVDVATAFMGEPRLIVLDEPTNDLDPVHRRLVWNRVDALRHERQVTCLLVTHNLLEAERVADRVVVLQNGRVAADGSPGELKRRLGDGMRLDVYLSPHVAPETVRTTLAGLEPQLLIRPGHLQVHVERTNVAGALERLLRAMDCRIVEDFRLAPPSLEDVYLRIDGGRHAPLAE